MAKNPEEQNQQTKKRKRKPRNTSITIEGENRLSIMQAAFDQFDRFGISFRDKLIDYCDWSKPTYYRKKRHGMLNKQEVAALSMAFTTVLREIFTYASDLAKLMPPEDIKKWSTVASLMGLDGTGEFRLISKKLRKTIEEKIQETINE